MKQFSKLSMSIKLKALRSFSLHTHTFTHPRLEHMTHTSHTHMHTYIPHVVVSSVYIPLLTEVIWNGWLLSLLEHFYNGSKGLTHIVSF